MLRDGKAVASLAFGTVERFVGQLNQLILSVLVRRGQCGDADTQGNMAGDRRFLMGVACTCYLIHKGSGDRSSSLTIGVAQEGHIGAKISKNTQKY